MKVRLVDNWRQAWRLWSVRFATAVGLLPEILYRLAEAAEHLLPSLSGPVLDNLPPWLRSVAAMLALVAVALRLMRQPQSARREGG